VAAEEGYFKLTLPPPPPLPNKRTKYIIISAILAAVLVLSVFAVVFLGGSTNSNLLPFSQPSPTPTPTPVPRAVLTVTAGVDSAWWARDNSTDLPARESSVRYYIQDSGNAPATSVSLTVTVDGRTYFSTVVPWIEASGSYSGSLTLSTPYDQTDSVVVSASCQDSSNSESFIVGADFPSSPYASSGNLESALCELFVTPNEAKLASTRENILSNKFFLNPDWTALWEWVGNNVDYLQEDSSTYHWQFPKDTLSSKYGMCADYSTLLVSLYRGGTFGPNDCYVVAGTNAEGKGHAWVVVRLPIVGWYTLEPQANGNFLVNLVANPFYVNGYTGQYQFNDQQFITLNP
jgi:hypothetical protein